MMIPDKIHLVVHCVMVISIEHFVGTRAQTRNPSYGNQSQSNVREIYHATNFSRGRPGESRTSTDIPISFKAPDVGSQNFWNYYNSPGSGNRRMFWGDLGYFNYARTNLFPNLNSFFEFMNPLPDKGNTFTPLPQAITKNVPEPYRYEYPYNFGPATERHFLPPPKPIRASIVKLETVTRSPDPFEYSNPTDLPSFSNLRPIPALKPVSLHIDELGFHPAHNVNFRQGPVWDSKPELSTSHFINNITSTVYLPSSAEVHQQSIKVVPPTIQEHVIKDENDTDKGARVTKGATKSDEESGNFNLNNDSLSGGSEQNFGKAPQHETEEPDGKRRKNGIKSQTPTTVPEHKDSKSGAASEGERTAPTQITRPYAGRNSIKIVTELTLEGLSKNNRTANIPRYPKVINMSDVINYELNKLKRNKFMRPRSDDTEERQASFSRSLADRPFAGDVLSLDLKILKDTNWDGFTTEDSPGRELAETGTTEKGDNSGGPRSGPEIDFSYDPNKGNSSEADYATKHEEIHDNKTIIVETRVTKSITKVLPTTHRRTYKKLRASSKGVEALGNVINRIASKRNNPRNQTLEKTESRSEIAPQLSEEGNLYSSDIAMGGERTNTSQNSEPRNETALTAGIHLNGAQENGHNFGRYNFTRRSGNGMYGDVPKRPDFPVEDVGEETPAESTTAAGMNQVNVSEPESYQPEKVSESHVTTAPKPVQSNNLNETEHAELKTTRKRKYKRRQKLKRRRTGKRRQDNAVTTEQNNSKLIASEN